MFVLTEIPVSDAQMYLKTGKAIKTGTERMRTTTTLMNVQLCALYRSWPLVGYTWRPMASLSMGGGWYRHSVGRGGVVLRNAMKSPNLLIGKSKFTTKFPVMVIPVLLALVVYAKISKIFKTFTDSVTTSTDFCMGSYDRMHVQRLQYYRTWAKLWPVSIAFNAIGSDRRYIRCNSNNSLTSLLIP